MRQLIFLILFLPALATAQTFTSSLSAFSKKWDRNVFQQANTAADAAYLTPEEKKVIEILNLVRLDPALFAETVLKQYPEHTGRPALKNNTYYKSLAATLKKQTPLPLLYPDQGIFLSAKCHAITAGKAGYLGHDRKSTDCSKNYNGECCAYGYSNALDIVLSLLIDENIPSLGHRNIMLSSYSKIGVSIQPHRTYRTNAVLDFLY